MASGMETMNVAVVGTGDGSIKATTPEGHSNFNISYVSPILAILIRSSRVFINTLLGLLSAAMVKPDAIPASDFLELLLKCAGLSVAAACVATLTSAGSLLAKLEDKFPSLGV